MSARSAVSRLRWIALGGTAAIAVAASSASAQSSGQSGNPSAGEGQAGPLAEIVVTAERRATNLQDTPLSIVAMTEESVAAKGIEDLQDLSTFTPNLSISASRGNGNNSPNFTIRGISGGGGATGERGVGLYIDGVYVPRTSGSVLRGPQGTLFGRNSTGGAIRIFSRQPDYELGGYIRGTVGNFDRHDIVGMLNLPVTDNFAVRMQGAWLNQDGYVTRGTQELGASEDVIGRVVARWEPTSESSATFSFLYSNAKADGTPLVFREFDMRPGVEGVIQGNYADWISDSFKAAGQAPLAAYNDPRIVTGDPFTAPSLCLLDDFNPDYDSACLQFNNNKYWQADLATEFPLGDTVTVSTVTGLSKLDHEGVSDYQLLGMEYRRDDVESETLYSEIQLNAELFGGALDFIVGGNYFYERSEAPNYVINRRGTSAFPSPAQQASPTFNLANFAFGDGDAGLFRTADTFTRQKSESFGAFVNATWHITPGLDLTGGLRYSHDAKDYVQRRFAEFLPSGAPGAFRTAPGTSSTTVQDDASFEQIDYRATLDYDITPDIMVYATVSKAYKAGTYSYTIQSWTAANNATGENQSAVIAPVPPEKVQNFEVGTRMTLFGGRVRFNPTLFYMQYTNRQAARQVACTPPGVGSCPPVGFSINVVDSGDVDIWGGELDLQIAVTDEFTIDASGAILDYDVKDPVANSGPNLFPDAPSPSFNVGATWNTDFGFGATTFNLNYAYVGEQETHPTAVGDSAFRMDDYGLVNARIRVVPNDGALSITLFANNLLDETYATYAQRFGGGFWDAGAPTGLAAPPRSALGEVRGRPREVGLTLQYDF